MNSISYDRDTISLANIKYVLNFKELKTKLGVQDINNQANNFFAKYFSGDRDLDQGISNSNGSSKTNKKNVKYHL